MRENIGDAIPIAVAMFVLVFIVGYSSPSLVADERTSNMRLIWETEKRSPAIFFMGFNMTQWRVSLRHIAQSWCVGQRAVLILSIVNRSIFHSEHWAVLNHFVFIGSFGDKNQNDRKFTNTKTKNQELSWIISHIGVGARNIEPQSYRSYFVLILLIIFIDFHANDCAIINLQQWHRWSAFQTILIAFFFVEKSKLQLQQQQQEHRSHLVHLTEDRKCHSQDIRFKLRIYEECPVSMREKCVFCMQ